jgi:hypothetical protein
MALAKMVFGEGAGVDKDTKHMIASTALNRLNSGKTEEFGANIPEVLQKGYYAVKNPNTPYKQAVEGKFPDKKSEDSWKEAVAVSSGLLKGTVAPREGQFYFKAHEIEKLKKKPKAFNFKAVKKVGDVGDYQVFGY